LRVASHLLGNLLRQRSVDTTGHVDLGQLGDLSGGVRGQLVPLNSTSACIDSFWLRTETYYARPHREGSADQPGDTGQHHWLGRVRRRRDARDQGEVRDQAVDHAEHRRPQPSTHVAVFVADHRLVWHGSKTRTGSVPAVPVVRDVVAAMDEWFPPGRAEPWDAVGLVCGDPADPVNSVHLAVDCVPAPSVRPSRKGRRCSSRTIRCCSAV
jgi:hypothetical protein